MSKFAVTNSSGAVLRVGSCPEPDLSLQAGEGELLFVGDYETDDVIDIESGNVVGKASSTAAPPDPPSFAAARRLAYPSIGSQLDMLWHAMDRGEIPKAVEWFERIAAVKAAHPKAPTDTGFEEHP